MLHSQPQIILPYSKIECLKQQLVLPHFLEMGFLISFYVMEHAYLCNPESAYRSICI